MKPIRKIIIGIHGLGNKPPAPLLRLWWKMAILEGLRERGFSGLSFRFELVSWADVLHPRPQDPSVSDPEDERYISGPYKPRPRTAEPKPKSTREKIVDYIKKQIDKLLFNEDFSINFASVSDYLIEKYFSDLNSYFEGSSPEGSQEARPARIRIRNRLKQVLEKHRDKEILLIAHSMGSIVAYDVLHQPDLNATVNTFITIGSPLGIPVIISKSLAEYKREFGSAPAAKTPECVTGRWLNLSDLEDRIVYDADLQDDYQANTSGVKVRDVVVFNDYRFKGEENHHKSYGYLRTPEMAAALADFLEEDANRALLMLRKGVNKIVNTAVKARQMMGVGADAS